MPHDKDHVLADVHQGGPKEVEAAIKAAAEAWEDWHRVPWEERAAIFLRAAELLAGPWRDTLNAATMLGQSKTAHQAEIDAACELDRLLALQPRVHDADVRGAAGLGPRRLEPAGVPAARGLRLRRLAVQLHGDRRQPDRRARAHGQHRRLEAGLDGDALRLLHDAPLRGGRPPARRHQPRLRLRQGRSATPALASPDLAGVHFTGSTAVFQGMWKTIGANIASYRSYPRIVGETGGKDFIVAHPTANAEAVATAILRGSFEYQGQKCSAASRVYAPASMWPAIQEQLVAQVGELKYGDVSDFSNFMGAVIDASSFATQKEAIEEAKADAKSEIVVGGGYDDSEGYFVEPTVIRTEDPDFRLLRDELFGPVVTTFVYPDGSWEETLELIDRTAPYALTGAIFAGDREAVIEASDVLRYTAGNLYVNDKPTGAVVAQQPFGGARASGTNDKAGSLWNLIRWVSPRTIKETFVPPTDYRYPYMSPDGDAG